MRDVHARLALVAVCWLPACAQPPTVELKLAERRVEAAREAEAARYAPDRLAEAETALDLARGLAVEPAGYPTAIRRAGEAVAVADEAVREAELVRRIASRRVDRCLNELLGLLAIASSRGATERNPERLAALQERYRIVAAVAASGDLPRALEMGRHLKPEALAFEQRFRR